LLTFIHPWLLTNNPQGDFYVAGTAKGDVVVSNKEIKSLCFLGLITFTLSLRLNP